MSWNDAVAEIQKRTALIPRVGVVLGSGLGAFASELSERVEIPYEQIPGWPKSTAIGHDGKLVIGKIGETVVAVQSGRAHFYEGYNMSQVTYGVRVLGKLGIKSLVLTNAGRLPLWGTLVLAGLFFIFASGRFGPGQAIMSLAVQSLWKV